MAATLTGVGIGRFAYVAILPLLVQQAWFSRTEAGYLGAANLVGYLLGIVLAAWLPRYLGGVRLMRCCMLLCSLSFLACAWRGAGIYWFLCWRTTVGACGAVLMVLAPVLILPHSAPRFRGRIGGIVFSGVGLGIVASATVVPSLMARDLAATWLALAGLCLTLTMLTWRRWPPPMSLPPPPPLSPAPCLPVAPARSWPAWPAMPAPVWLLLVAYTLNAVGYLPHTLFWADYLLGELHRPLVDAAFFWACFGIGAACGPYLTGVIADRFGLGKTLTAAFLLKAGGVALPLLEHGGTALLLSSLLVGFFSPGIVGAASSYTLEIGGLARHKANWTAMSFCFAAAQAGAANAMVWIVGGRTSYRILFCIGSAALLLSALCMLLICLLRREKTVQFLRV